MKKRMVGLAFLMALSGFSEEAGEMSPEETVVEQPATQPEASSEHPPATPAPAPVIAPAPISAPATEMISASNKTDSADMSPWVFGVQFGQIKTNSSSAGTLEKTSYAGGASLEYQTMDRFSLQAELNYMNKGWRGAGAPVGNEVSLKYFEVPLFFKAKFPWNNLVPSVMAGPWIAYLHSATDNTLGMSLDTTSTTKRFEYGVYVGAGLDLALSNKIEMGISARYGWGLSDVNEFSLQESVYNRALQLLASLRFRL